jgi:hypothetical protein
MNTCLSLYVKPNTVWAVLAALWYLPAGFRFYIDTKAECRHLKNLPVKGLCGRCLSVPISPPRFLFGLVWQFCRFLNLVRYRVLDSCIIWSPTGLNITPYPLPAMNCLYLLYFDTVEPERRLEGQQFTQPSRKHQHDWLYLQFINADKHLPQSPFTG